MTIKQGPWQWWAGSNEEWMQHGPFESREDAIAESVSDGTGEFKDEDGSLKLGIHVVEARQDPLRLSEWLELDQLIERAEENLADSDRVASEYDGGPWFEITFEQKTDLEKRIRQACDEWQAAHGLAFKTRRFSASRNSEYLVVPAEVKP